MSARDEQGIAEARGQLEDFVVRWLYNGPQGHRGPPPPREALDDLHTDAANAIDALLASPEFARCIADAKAEGYATALSKPEIDKVRAKVLLDAADAWRRTWWDARPPRFEDWLRARADALTEDARGEDR